MSSWIEQKKIISDYLDKKKEEELLNKKRKEELKSLSKEERKARPKEIITCECGSRIQRCWMSQHRQTKKHYNLGGKVPSEIIFH